MMFAQNNFMNKDTILLKYLLNSDCLGRNRKFQLVLIKLRLYPQHRLLSIYISIE